MKIKIIFLIAFLIVTLGYFLFLGIGMSSTYPAIKEYSFGANKVSFEQKLSDRVNSSIGWSLKRKYSIKRENEECYWVSLFYNADKQDLEYILKYCFKKKELAGNDECTSLEVVNITDYNNKKNSHELRDKDVEKLLEILNRTIVNGMAPACSTNKRKESPMAHFG